MVKFQKKENKYWQVLVLLQHLRSEYVLSQTSLKIFFSLFTMGLKNYSNGTDVPLETRSDNEIDPVPLTNNMLFIYQSANMQNMQSI